MKIGGEEGEERGRRRCRDSSCLRKSRLVGVQWQRVRIEDDGPRWIEEEELRPTNGNSIELPDRIIP